MVNLAFLLIGFLLILLLFDEIFPEIGLGIHTRQNYLAATFARSSWWAIKLSMTDWSWNADDPKTMNPLTAIPQWNPPFNPAMILRVAIQLVGPPTLTKNRGWWAPDLGPVVGWFQTTGKGWLGCVQNEYQEDVTTLWVRHWWHTTSMTGSGGFTPGTPVSTHKKDLIQKENKRKREFHFILNFL